MRKVLRSVETSARFVLKSLAKLTEQNRQNRHKSAQNRFFPADAISLASCQMFVTTLGEREGILFFSRPQSSEFLSQLGLKC